MRDCCIALAKKQQQQKSVHEREHVHKIKAIFSTEILVHNVTPQKEGMWMTVHRSDPVQAKLHDAILQYKNTSLFSLCGEI